MLDLRSDTVTRPTETMRKAMTSAEVGDDVYEEDPTVNALEEQTASLLEKEKALYVPTCTMANLIAILVHCPERMTEMIVGDKQHIYLYEVGGSSSLAGVHSAVVKNEMDGTLELSNILENIRGEDIHQPITKLIALENTHNSCGGIPLSRSYIDDVSYEAHKRQIRVHMDGARLFNASVATKEHVAKLCQSVDSTSICLSKGLASPMGALLVGESSFIRRARHMRKALGGGMRQAGVMAAAGIVSLTQMTNRLEEDHLNAERIAHGLANIDNIEVDIASVRTNMVYFGVAKDNADLLVEKLKRDYGVLVGAYSTKLVRLVTHKDIPSNKIEYIIESFQKATKSVFS